MTMHPHSDRYDSAIRTFLLAVIFLSVTRHACAQLIAEYRPMSTGCDTIGATMQWEQKLSEALTAEDSISALFNLYDLNVSTERGKYSRPLYDLAGRNKMFAIQLDLIRNIANTYSSSDSIINLLIQESENLPESYDQQETLTFVKLRREYARIESMTDEEAERALSEALLDYGDADMSDCYQRITNLSTITYLLARCVPGDLYKDYVNRLVALAEAMPAGNGSVRSAIYTRAANIYTRHGEYSEAVKADSVLLKIVDSLQYGYIRDKRIYRDIDRSRFVCYRRMLSNYPALSKDDVRTIYKRMHELAAVNTSIRRDMSVNPRSEAFYLVAIGQYGPAITQLRKALEHRANQPLRKVLLQNLIFAADKTGDKDELLRATTEYNAVLESIATQTMNQKYHELQVLFDMNELQDSIANNQSTDLQGEIDRMKKTVYCLGGLSIILLLLLIMAVYRRRLNK